MNITEIKGCDSFGVEISVGSLIATGQSPRSLTPGIVQSIVKDNYDGYNLAYVRLYTSQVCKKNTEPLEELRLKFEEAAKTRQTWNVFESGAWSYYYDNSYPLTESMKFSVVQHINTRDVFVIKSKNDLPEAQRLNHAPAGVYPDEVKQQINEVYTECLAVFKDEYMSGKTISKILSPYNKRIAVLTADYGLEFMKKAYEVAIAKALKNRA